MSKTYKGYELIKAIADGEIKNGTYIKVHDLSVLDKVVTTILYSNQKLNWEAGEFDTSYLSNNYCYFELIEDEEIDIDNIEDLRYETVIETLGKCDCYTGNEYYCLKTLIKNDENLLKSNAENHRKINELIKAVKQINNKLKEKEYCECCGVELTEQNKALSNMCNECKYGLDRD